jgi:hypothetical protein
LTERLSHIELFEINEVKNAVASHNKQPFHRRMLARARLGAALWTSEENIPCRA